MSALPDSNKRTGVLPAIAGAFVLLALPFLVFWPVTLGQQIWVGGDFSTLHYPYFVVNTEQWRQGQIPLWNPYIYAGTPLAASQEGSSFYPLNIVLWLTMPPSRAMGYSVLVHLALTGLAMFTFLRSLRLHPAAALLGGLTLQFGGFAMSHLGHLVILRALPWIGFGLYSYNRWADSRSRCFLAGIAASVGMLWLSGHPQTILYGMLLVGTYFLFGRRVTSGVVLPGLGAIALGAGLSAIQVLPGLSLWLSRDYCTLNECGPVVYGTLPLHPAYLLTLLFPNIRRGTYAEMVGYVGVASLLLGAASLLYREETRRARPRGFFALWAGVALFLSLGRFVPFLPDWLALVPVYGELSRVPSRHLLEFGYSMAVLAALGPDGLLRGPSFEEVVVYRNPSARPRLYMALLMTPDQFQRFGESLSMVGYALQRGRETPDHRLVTWWHCDRPLAADYTLFMHYLDLAGGTLAQDDHRLGKMAPAVENTTSRWTCPGYFSDDSRIPPEAWGDGSLQVGLGVWIPETGERLAASGGLPVDQYGRTRLQLLDATPDGKAIGSRLATGQGEDRPGQMEPAPGFRGVQVIRYSGDRIAAMVEGEQDGILVHSAPYVPGWRVTVDGKAVPLLQVNGFLQGALVPAGRHLVQFWYEPASFGLGTSVTLASLAIVVVLLLWPTWKRRKADRPADCLPGLWRDGADG